MSHTDLYFARKVSKSIGITRNLWMPKLPRIFDDSPGNLLLGSLVEEIDGPGKDYPLPFPMTTPQILLHRLKEEKQNINLNDRDELILSQSVANAKTSVTAGRNFDLDFGSNFPGIPLSLGFGLANSKLAKLSLTLNDGAELKFIPTDFIARFHRLFNGKDSVAFPNIAVDVDDHLFINLIVLANKYSVEYEYSEQFGARVDAEIENANASLSPNIEFKKTSEFSMSVSIKNDTPYLIGFSTIDWDDL